MKLYTRTGDDGTTGLFGGERVGKDHPRVAAYGSVDELNAWLGLVSSACDPSRPVHARFIAILATLQARLFELGADLATPADTRHESKIARIAPEHVTEAERFIDEIDAGNAPLRHFVLPGGSELASRLHVARTICRRGGGGGGGGRG
jgi:cob(I)alamin adenosyltransferase